MMYVALSHFPKPSIEFHFISFHFILFYSILFFSFLIHSFCFLIFSFMGFPTTPNLTDIDNSCHCGAEFCYDCGLEWKKCHWTMEWASSPCPCISNNRSRSRSAGSCGPPTRCRRGPCGGSARIGGSWASFSNSGGAVRGCNCGRWGANCNPSFPHYSDSTRSFGCKNYARPQRQSWVWAQQMEILTWAASMWRVLSSFTRIYIRVSPMPDSSMQSVQKEQTLTEVKANTGSKKWRYLTHKIC